MSEETITLKDVFELAEQLEKNGMQFYQRCADHVDSAEGRELLLEIASMEKEHLLELMKINSMLFETDTASIPLTMEGHALETIQYIIKVRPFYGRDLPLSSLEEILTAAIRMEEDFILFYKGIKNLVPEEFMGRVDRLVKEEERHIEILRIKLDELTA